MSNQQQIHLLAIIPQQFAGMRLDQAIAKLFPDHSRERLKQWILSGECLVNNNKWKPKDKLKGQEQILIQADLIDVTDWQAENLPLNIIYEDEYLLVVNKPANCIVHPGAGNSSGTLVNALLNYSADLKKLPRAGIVHRLDKDTTGLLVVAKTIATHTYLVGKLQARDVSRIYEAIVVGNLTAGGTINKPIARDYRDRKKMAVVPNGKNGKEAITHYRILKKFPNHTHLQITLETGRTHQIRVHMACINHPIVGDKTYCKRVKPPLINYARPALHARRLSLLHPVTKEYMTWEVPLTPYILEMLDILQHD